MGENAIEETVAPATGEDTEAAGEAADGEGTEDEDAEAPPA